MRGDKVLHAEIQIGASRLMISEEYPESFMASPQSLGGSAVHIYLYLDDVDASAKRVEGEGFECLMPVQDEFDGDRRGGFRDPFGHIWFVSSSTFAKRLKCAAQVAGYTSI